MLVAHHQFFVEWVQFPRSFEVFGRLLELFCSLVGERSAEEGVGILRVLFDDAVEVLDGFVEELEGLVDFSTLHLVLWLGGVHLDAPGEGPERPLPLLEASV